MTNPGRSLYALLALALLAAAPGRSDAQTSFSNTTPISIPDAGTTSSVSSISVSGLTGGVSALTVQIKNISAPGFTDLDFLLVSPSGQKFIVVSDVGGFSTINNITLTFSDAAASFLSTGTPTTGTWKPTNLEATVDAFPSPAPAGPYASPPPFGSDTFVSAFSGIGPNGTWSLYAIDDAAGGGTNNINGGWTLTLTTAAIQSTTTDIQSSLNPSFTSAPNNSVQFTATVTSSGSPVTSGTVTFKEGSTVLAGPTALDGAGHAAFTTSALAEGTHTISAFYNGTASFAISSGSVVQTVDSHTVVVGNAYSNPGTISVLDAPAVPYPSHIFVSGFSGALAKVTVVLRGFSAGIPADLDFLLVAPGGQKYVFMSDAGGFTSVGNLILTFDDAAPSQLPYASTLTTGTWRPADSGGGADVFPAPAPAGPYSSATPNGSSTIASIFSGIDPNGTWSLYVTDDTGGGGTSTISQGWTLNLTGAVATATAIESSLNPSFTSAPDNSVQFTATVTTGVGSVNSGTVTFRDGVTVIGGPTALNISSQAVLTTTALAEGTHSISATYNGNLNFTGSNASLTQTVNNHTTITIPSFCNDGAITIPDAGAQVATPWPSNIFVDGFGGPILGFTVTLRGLTEGQPDDLDLLLVGPGGQKFVLMSDVGGVSPANNLTLNLSDAAGSQLPDNSALGSGTFKPTAVNAGGVISFPAPAPAGPYLFAAPFGASTLASVFNGASPNGTWSLYVVDDNAGGGAGALANGWCLNFAPAMAGVEDGPLEGTTTLARPVPEPMRTSTTLRFSLARAGEARLEVFDASGRRVRTLLDGTVGAGWHEASWDGRDAEGRDTEGGVYFARLHSAGAWSVQRIVRLK